MQQVGGKQALPVVGEEGRREESGLVLQTGETEQLIRIVRPIQAGERNM